MISFVINFMFLKRFAVKTTAWESDLQPLLQMSVITTVKRIFDNETARLLTQPHAEVAPVEVVAQMRADVLEHDREILLGDQ